MIIKHSDRESSKSKISYGFILALVAILALIGYFFLKEDSQKAFSGERIMCDAENIKGEYFVNDNFKFGNAHTQSSELFYSGNYSSKLDAINQYGMVCQIEAPESYSRITATIKYNGPINKINFACNGNKGSNVYYNTNAIYEHLDKGWYNVKLDIIVPKNDKLKFLKIFPYNYDPNVTVFYDDLEVLIEKPNQDYEAFYNSVPFISMYLDPKAKKIIKTERDNAINKGILITNENSWAKGKISIDDSIQTEVKLRLKGDWADHLVGDDWSYRIKMPGDIGWNGMMEFSVQHPIHRFYLKEWLYHKVLEREDVLATKYDFVRFELNDRDFGIYAYEEHMLKQIPESRYRREGVIVKFGEDINWQRILEWKESGFERNMYEGEERINANVEAFKYAKILNNANLKEQWQKAHELLHQYQNNSAPVDEIFDIERMAKFFAICDVFEANHSTIWHNQRFYYNPITRVLEPIGFDGFTENGELTYRNMPFLGSYKNDINGTNWYQYYQILFSNEKFSKQYAHYLNKYSTKEYLEEIINEFGEQIAFRENLLSSVKNNYRLDLSRISKKAEEIQLSLHGYDDFSVKAFIQSQNDSLHVAVANIHRLPIRVIGSGMNENYISNNSDTVLNGFVLTSRPRKPRVYKMLTIPSDAKYLYWQVEGLEDVFSTRISSIKAPDKINVTALESQRLKLPLDSTKYSKSSDNITFLAGDITITEPIIIPDGYDVIFNEGCHLSLNENAYFLSYSPVSILGSEENKVIIQSNGKNQGFNIIKPQGECFFRHVSFTGLDRLQHAEWQLTGAVTAYEADITMKNVIISNNKCEDALNLIRSNFMIDKLLINETFADGFDADFCKGTIKNSVLTNTGNDGLDFSGGHISVFDCRLINLGDKGLSGGEQSTIDASNIVIDGAVIGIASKDKTHLQVQWLDLKNCNKGLSAYQKKPEYGGGFLSVKGMRSEEVTHLIMKDEQSIIKIDNVKQ